MTAKPARLSIRMKSTRPFVVVATAALLLAGCGSPADNGSASSNDGTSAAKVTSSATFDKAMRKTPCKIIDKATVAATFDLPADKIEGDEISSVCDYQWEGANEELYVEVYVTGVYDDAESASYAFRQATRNRSAQEVAEAMDKVRKQVDQDSKLKTEGQRKAASGITGAIGADGFAFVDVDGVGDEARFDAHTGELKVRVGNLRFHVSAYKGASMPIPDEITGSSMVKAHKAWVADTLEQRKQMAVTLTKAALENI